MRAHIYFVGSVEDVEDSEPRPKRTWPLGEQSHELGFSKGFWMVPFPTKYKHERVVDYLWYQVTQSICQMGREEGAAWTQSVAFYRYHKWGVSARDKGASKSWWKMELRDGHFGTHTKLKSMPDFFPNTHFPWTFLKIPCMHRFWTFFCTQIIF